MSASRVFVSYTNRASKQYEQFAVRFMNDLRAAGAEVITDGGSVSDVTFVQTINQELPMCQWFIFVESPDALQSPRIQMTVNTAINLLMQRQLQGAFRVVTEQTQPQDVPPSWSKLRTFDATHQYSTALTQVIAALHLKTRHATVFVPPMPSHSPAQSAYDRPTGSPRPPFFRSWKGRALLGLIALLLLGLIGSLVIRATFFASPTRANINPTSFGNVHFTSSNLLDRANSQGIDDGLEVDLANLASPSSGKSYYGWLLPDKGQVDANPILLGKLPIQHGTIHFSYVNPSHTNLLGSTSRFLVTENDANFSPGTLSDRTAWRYYAEIPQVRGSAQASANQSLLDLLRHLLVSDPKLVNVSLQGGLNIWLLQNSRKVLEWATAARGTGLPQEPLLMHRHFVRILDYLDGAPFVQNDVPAGTPILSDPQVARVALLTFDPTHQDAQGYVDVITQYLRDMGNAPGVTSTQRDNITKIINELAIVKVNLEQVHQDAKKLVGMNNAQLLDPATAPLLDNLVAYANNAYVGQIDSNTGMRQGGIISIYDAIGSLASVNVMSYTAS